MPQPSHQPKVLDPTSLTSTQVLVGLATASSGATNAAALRSAVPRETVVGLLRDVRGIASATNSRRTYGVPFSQRTALCGVRKSGNPCCASSPTCADHMAARCNRRALSSHQTGWHAVLHGGALWVLLICS